MSVALAPITTADLRAVGWFLHENLNRSVPIRSWVRALQVPWKVPQPNHGYLLAEEGRVVGAYLAYYSEREIAGRSLRVCNLGAWCVLDSHRHQGLRLLTTLLKQKGYAFTDFSPSGNVVPLNRRLKFVDLDTTTALLPNIPAPPRRGVKVTSNPEALLERLTDQERRVYLDHRDTAAARHLLLATPHDHSYVVLRRDSRKGVRAFATVLHASNPELFRRHARNVAGHLMIRHGIPATLVELRVAGGRPAGSVLLSTSRPKMFRSDDLDPEHVDYLYSELTCLEW
ncbi:hypothetical protein [Nocardioides sp. CER19]|uniref:hypothetical protein n=1 Tax=Nocardioides sp. CER19 TaxID=3038538 RepID=UPI00244B52A1|nr:hypothetical protein [Nocardioides sp. CER19]MDH2414831.1 hypothetical protein [Nocardioides sp. CER19]